MDQHLNNGQNKFLWTLLANPANDAYLHAYNLQQLVNDFPQSGFLQALLAYASDEKNLKQASVYFNTKSLFKLINTPSAFIDITDEKIIIQNEISANIQNDKKLPEPANLEMLHDEGIKNLENGNTVDHNPGIEHNPEEQAQADSHESVEFEGHPDVNNGEVYENHHFTEILTEVSNDSHPADYTSTEKLIDEPPAILSNQETSALVNAETIENDESQVEEEVAETVHIPVIEDEQAEKQIEEEIFDEIVGIEQINIDHSANQTGVHEHKEESALDEKPGTTLTTANEEEKLIFEDIAADDFFMFDRAFGEHKQVDQLENNPPVTPDRTFHASERKLSLSFDAEHRDVSKYYDEKMPYSFMWWLDKTRREHAGLYQPYVKSGSRHSYNKEKKPADELQQQYYENIFHITSLEELDKSTAHQTVEFDMKRKEHQIIERFIQEEPQIKPQSSDKIDNENKAKKSSEDSDELITETLASIYTEQMLYHKAIAAYKKLMLKFPEKSRYFADKIEQIEKKTN